MPDGQHTSPCVKMLVLAVVFAGVSLAGLGTKAGAATMSLGMNLDGLVD
jgi:hypothetical protein